MRKWKPQTKPNPNQTLENQGRSPKGARSLCLPASEARSPCCCRAPPRGLSPAPHLPARGRPGAAAPRAPPPLTAPGGGRTGAEARHPARRSGLQAEWPLADAHHTSRRRAQVTVVRAQGRPRPGCSASGRRSRAAAGASGPGSCAGVSLPARSSPAQEPGSPLRPHGTPRAARDWTPLLPRVIALGFCNLKN